MNENIEGCFKILDKHGDTKPELYKYMLRFIVSKKSILIKYLKMIYKYYFNRLTTTNY